MGRNLFIRVSAATYDEELMRKEWARLCALAWPEETGGKGPALNAGEAQRDRRGIMELTADLPDRIVYGALPGRRPEVLRPLAEALRDRFTSLEAALGDRDIALAGKLTNSLEAALDALEASLAVKEKS
jgi:hypothetical protein